MTIDEEFNCLGYFGFGNGISIVRNRTNYCNGCPMGRACWEAHRVRCKQFFPDLCALVDKIGAEKNGGKKIFNYIHSGGTEPYVHMMMGNMEDGVQVLETGKPKGRGPYTLKYPFE